MKKFIKNLSGEKKLGGVALVLGLVAVLLGNPYDKVNTTINTKKIAIESIRGNDKIDVKSLADWIIEGRVDFRLVDLRDDEKFSEYSIPTAVNIPVSKLMDSDLMRNQKIVLYSDDNTNAAQGWFLLKSKDYNGVYILDGGLEAWKDEVLFPSLAANASEEEKAEFEKMAEVSKFFGGTPQTGTEEDEKEITMPKLELPAAVPMTMPKRKPKREGC
jgi:rhodanese-related sulfurtransferase